MSFSFFAFLPAAREAFLAGTARQAFFDGLIKLEFFVGAVKEALFVGIAPSAELRESLLAIFGSGITG